MKFRIISPRIGEVGSTITHDELIAKGGDIANLVASGFISLVESKKKESESDTIETTEPKE